MYIFLLLLIRAVLQKFKHAKNGPRLIFKKVWLHAILFLAVLFLAMLYRSYVDSGKTSKNKKKQVYILHIFQYYYMLLISRK